MLLSLQLTLWHHEVLSLGRLQRLNCVSTHRQLPPGLRLSLRNWLDKLLLFLVIIIIWTLLYRSSILLELLNSIPCWRLLNLVISINCLFLLKSRLNNLRILLLHLLRFLPRNVPDWSRLLLRKVPLLLLLLQKLYPLQLFFPNLLLLLIKNRSFIDNVSFKIVY